MSGVLSRATSRLTAAACAMVLVAGAAGACSSEVADGSSSGTAPSTSATAPQGQPTSSPTDSASPSPSPTPVGPAKVSVQPAAGTDAVRPDQPVVVSVASGSISSLAVAGPDDEKLPGSFNADKTRWTGEPGLKPGATYTVTGLARGTDGKDVRIASRFSTMPAQRRLKASVSPLAGMRVGVAIPIQVFWNHPVKDKAAVERRLTVRTSVPVEGSWHWYGDKQVNFRPKNFWPANTKVSVDIDIQGVNAGNGVWGWADRQIDFQIGPAVLAYVDVPKHQMIVSINGKVARRIPITAGKAGFTTRSGIKVIMEKYRVKRMDARTVGIRPGDPEYYDIHDVPYAHRVTSSGEFVHGAYWSESNQGRANVSHGCVGMSVKDAAWYFSKTSIGDPVIVRGTNRRIEPGNGWTDWTLSWDKYRAGSALS